MGGKRGKGGGGEESRGKWIRWGEEPERGRGGAERRQEQEKALSSRVSRVSSNPPPSFSLLLSHCLWLVTLHLLLNVFHVSWAGTQGPSQLSTFCVKTQFYMEMIHSSRKGGLSSSSACPSGVFQGARDTTQLL